MIATFLQRAIMQGIPLLFGSTGEIITEKAGRNSRPPVAVSTTFLDTNELPKPISTAARSTATSTASCAQKGFVCPASHRRYLKSLSGFFSTPRTFISFLFISRLPCLLNGFRLHPADAGILQYPPPRVKQSSIYYYRKKAITPPQIIPFSPSLFIDRAEKNH